MHQTDRFRGRVARIVESGFFQNFIIGLIIFNAITLGMETSDALMQDYGSLLTAIDTIVISVFVVEILLKLIAYGLGFFRSAWNIFDLSIVTIALIPASGPLTVLRSLRILRVLRLISMMPQLRMVVEALLRAFPGITAIAGLMLLLFYIGSVMATGLYGDSFPEWFGSIAASMYTLFQIMTLESWSMGIVRPVMESHPTAWLFFIPFILIATFTMLNLFIAIIIDAMQSMHEKVQQEEQTNMEDALHEEHQQLGSEIRALRQEIGLLRESLQGKTS